MNNPTKNKKKEVQPQANVVQQENDIYLRVNNEWFVYNTQSIPLGSGAMGTVYLGRSCQTNEKVAIKRVIDTYSNISSVRARARLEASLLFRHRNLVEMIGYCECNPVNGPIFIISRLVSGMTLDKHVSLRLRNRPDFVEKICQTIYPVLDALEYLHSKNIIHLDIKPSNIMIENGSNIRLMDLGIAFTSHTSGRISVPGLVGTPQYAAPEQIMKLDKTQVPINKTTDMYELGMTLYELLADTNPLDSLTHEETMEKLAHVTLPAISGVPASVMRVIRKATEKEQRNRFQSAGDFKAALKDALVCRSSSFVDILKNPFFIGCVVGVVLVFIIVFILSEII